MKKFDIEQQRKAFDEWYEIKPKGWFDTVKYNAAWRAWLAAQQQEGYVMVPVEPTWEMVEAAEGNNGHIESIYRDMIQAVQE